MLFASVFPYAMIKVARAMGELVGGPGAELALINRELERLQASRWPCFQSLGELQHVEEAKLICDASGSIAQSRSRMSGRFLMSKDCDVWVSIDDDIYAGRDTLRRCIVEARVHRCVAVVPYLLRDGKTASVSGLKAPSSVVRTSGMGLVAMHRDAVEAVTKRSTIAVDSQGLHYPALFLEYIDGGTSWLGEDIAFCRRLETVDVDLRVVFDAPICHAGRWSILGVDGSFSVDPTTAAEHKP